MQQAVERPGCKFDMGRQPRVDGMGDLVQVVADATQLGKDGWVEPMDGRCRDLKLASEDQVFAVGRQLQIESERLRRQTGMIVIRYAHVDLSAARQSRLPVWSLHRTPHQG